MTTFPVSDSDIRAIRTLVELRKSDPFLLSRQKDNVVGPAPKFDREYFWLVLLGCLLTTQQRSTYGSPVDRFLELNPFPLTLESCCGDIEKIIITALTAHKSIRMAPTIAHRAKLNYEWLAKDGWVAVEAQFCRLASQRNRAPQRGDATAEREAAHFAEVLVGIGPKQSRNLWQWLGLTRYGTPLDSRICDWINENLSITIDVGRLSNPKYYDSMLDHVQDVCSKADILPCMFDAAAFDYNQQATRSETRMSRPSKGTTEIGYRNDNGQLVIRDTGESGTDFDARKFQLACSRCGHNYGANSGDIWERKCPKCQGGKEGLPLEIEAHG
jgi:hypothetical protein